jgi:hypothetical protein
MDEKQLLEMSGIDAEDWEQTPASVRRLVVQLGLKIEQLEQHLKELQDSKEGLEEKVNRNSQNSHSSPASDSPNVEKTKKKNQQEKSEGGNPDTQVIVVPCIQWKRVIASPTTILKLATVVANPYKELTPAPTAIK